MSNRKNEVHLFEAKFLLLFLSILVTQIIIAQNSTIDSLDRLLKHAKNEPEKMALYNILSLEYIKLDNIDKAISSAIIPFNRGYFLNSSRILSQAYGKIRNYEKAYQYLSIYYHLYDSINNDSINLKIGLLEDNFKQEEEIKINELKEKQKAAIRLEELKHKEIIQFASIAGLILVIFIVFFFILRIIRIKQNTKKRLNEQKEKLKVQEAKIIEIQNELNRKYEEIKTTNAELDNQKKQNQEKKAELEAQNEEISSQRDILIGQNKSISDSIQYAKRIQRAVLPQQAYIDEILPDNFIFYIPRDVVSGDFYWVKQINQFVVVAVADCTGHGVPGAIMSMLGISFLNEIVQKREITQANQILNALRKQLKHTLKQTGREGDILDGMDIALCALDTKTKLLQYAGANNSVFIVQNGRPIEIHPDKMPIGFYPDEKLSFTNHEILLHEGDIFFMFTDGFVDQFGGTNGSRYKTVNFHNFLHANHSKPMETIKKVIEQELRSWMKGQEQIDDILVMGVRV